MKDASVIETPLIGSGSQEEADRRVNVLLELGTSRGFLTYEELNEKLPDEVVSPDKLDSLLMMIDEMGIKLIDEADIGEFTKAPRTRKKPQPQPEPEAVVEDENGEEIDLNLEAELAEASTKRIDDPVRMYLTQMGEIPLLTREQEIALAKKIEITRKIFRSKVLESDYCLQSAVEILQQVDDGDLPFDRTMKISTAEDQAEAGRVTHVLRALDRGHLDDGRCTGGNDCTVRALDCAVDGGGESVTRLVRVGADARARRQRDRRSGADSRDTAFAAAGGPCDGVAAGRRGGARWCRGARTGWRRGPRTGHRPATRRCRWHIGELRLRGVLVRELEVAIQRGGITGQIVVTIAARADRKNGCERQRGDSPPDIFRHIASL